MTLAPAGAEKNTSAAAAPPHPSDAADKTGLASSAPHHAPAARSFNLGARHALTVRNRLAAAWTYTVSARPHREPAHAGEGHATFVDPGKSNRISNIQHSSPRNKGGAGVVNGWTWIRPFSSLAHLDIGYSLLVIGYSLDVFHLFSAASAELIGHSKFHINILQRAKTTAEQLNGSI